MAKLRVIPWTQKNGLNLRRAVRMVKMIAARCEMCQPAGGRWWETCSHDPYHTAVVEVVRAPIVENNDADERIITGYQEKEVQHLKPNVMQVGLHTRIRSGRGVDAQRARGWKLPQEVDPADGKHTGYAPMCEFNNCYSPNPSIKTRNGSFCSRDHAAMIIAKAQGKVLEAYDEQKFRKQLEEIVIA